MQGRGKHEAAPILDNNVLYIYSGLTLGKTLCCCLVTKAKSISQINHKVFFSEFDLEELTCKMYTKVILVYTPASRVIVGGKYSNYN